MAEKDAKIKNFYTNCHQNNEPTGQSGFPEFAQEFAQKVHIGVKNREKTERQIKLGRNA